MKIIIATALACASAFGATTVSDVVYSPISGRTFSGCITVNGPDMTTVDGRTVARGSRSVQVTAGVFTLDLEPNIGSTPTASSYVVRYEPGRTCGGTGSTGAPWQEFWIIPSSGPKKINEVRTLTVPAVPSWFSFTLPLQRSGISIACPTCLTTSSTILSDSLTEGSTNLFFTTTRARSSMAGLYEVPLTIQPPLRRIVNTLDCPTCLVSTDLIPPSSLAGGIDAVKIGAGTVTNAVFGYLAGVTSGVQSQIDGKSVTGHTHVLTDVTPFTARSGSGTVAAVFASGTISDGCATITGGNLGSTGTACGAGSSGADPAAVYVLKTPNAGLTNAFSLSTMATGLVKVTTSTGALTTAVAGDIPDLSSIYSTKTCSGDLTGTLPGCTVATVGGSTASAIHSAEQLANAATNANTGGTIVKRDVNGDFAARNVQATLHVGPLNGNADTASALASQYIDWAAGSGGASIANKPSTFAPSAHATSHKNGGSDELATATPAANAIPKAGSGGTLAAGWIAGLAAQYIDWNATTGGTSIANKPTLATVATSGSAADLGTGTLPAGRLPTPGASTLGGIKSKVCAAGDFVSTVGTDGLPVCTTPPGTTSGSGITDLQVTAAAGVLTVGGTCSSTLVCVVGIGDRPFRFVASPGNFTPNASAPFSTVYVYVSDGSDGQSVGAVVAAATHSSSTANTCTGSLVCTYSATGFPATAYKLYSWDYTGASLNASGTLYRPMFSAAPRLKPASGSACTVTPAAQGESYDLDCPTSSSGSSETIRGWCFGTVSNSATNGVALVNLGGTPAGNCANGSYDYMSALMARGGTLSHLVVRAGTTGSGAGDGVFTVYVNGVSTALTCTIGNATPALCQDTTHTVTVSATDQVRVQGGFLSATMATVTAAILLQ